MNNRLISSLIIATLGSSFLSINIACAQKFYVTGNLAYDKFVHDISDDIKFTKLSKKVKAPNAFGVDLEAGYYFTDTVRLGLSVSVPFINQARTDVVYNNNDFIPVAVASSRLIANSVLIDHTKKTIIQKPKVTSMLANVVADFAEFRNVKFFVTGAVGIANLVNRVKYSKTLTTVKSPGTITHETSTVTKTAKANNFAFSVGIGASFDLSDKAHLDLAYSYRTYGHTKSPKVHNDYNVGTSLKYHLQGSHVSAGVRFDI